MKQTDDVNNSVNDANSSRHPSQVSDSFEIGIIEQTLRQQEQSSIDRLRNQPSPLKCFFMALTRKKPLDTRTDTNLNRCLDLLDLTTLGK